jgi:thiamine-monophosphate kinase
LSIPGEHALIERLRARVGAPRDWVRIGIGDDAAVVEPERGTADAITTDSLVEGVHFRREWTPPGALGHKALAVCLSDLAAMGARPRAALLTLAIPPGWSLDEFDALVDAFIACGTAAGAPLVGGNLTRSPGPLMIDATALGSVRHRRILTRTSGRPGDALYVTGRLGGAAAGLAYLATLADPRDRGTLGEDETDAVTRYERPDARVRCGLAVARARAASACIDLSDGLADGARQLATASATGVVVDAGALPLHPGAERWAERSGADARHLALAGGEDYELLFAVPSRRVSRFRASAQRCRGLEVTRIGELTDEPGAWLRLPDGRREPLPEGFQHL